MIEDTIEIKYPIEKLWTEEVDRNHRIEEIRQVSIEYILRFFFEKLQLCRTNRGC